MLIMPQAAGSCCRLPKMQLKPQVMQGRRLCQGFLAGDVVMACEGAVLAWEGSGSAVEADAGSADAEGPGWSGSSL